MPSAPTQSRVNSTLDRKDSLAYWAIAVMFAITGLVALTYQVAWNKILNQTVGTDHVSMTLVVSIFMLGLGLGSQLGAFLTRVSKFSIVFFFVAELFIAAFGYFSSPILRHVPIWTAHFSTFGPDSFYPDFIANFMVLFLPCLLMGISLPIVIHHFRLKFASGAATGFLYGANLIGAAIGAYFSGVFLIGWVGVESATHLASFLNISALAIVGVSVYLGGINQTQVKQTPQIQTSANFTTPLPRIYLISFITGFVALALEMIYFRLFVVYLCASSYVFPTILTTYLLQVSIGNAWAAKRIQQNRVREALKTILLWGGLSCFIVLLAPFVLRPLIGTMDRMLFEPQWGIRPLITGFIFSFVVMIPVAFVAAFFPLFVESISRDENSLGSVVGRIYMMQTIGNFFGSILSGLLIIPLLGPVLFLKVLSFLIAFIALYFLCTSFDLREARNFFRTRGAIVGMTLMVLASFIISDHLFYKNFKFSGKKPDAIKEDFEGTALLYKYDEATRIQVGSEPASSYSTKDTSLILWPMDVALAMRKNQAPKKILIIGLGTGIKANAIRVLYPESKVIVVELLGTLIDSIKADGSPLIRNLIETSEVHVTDGRRFVNKNPGLEGQFDIIELGINHITSAGSGGLYTEEFLGKLKTLLTPSGVLAFYAYLPAVKMAEQIFRNVVVASPGEIGVSEVFLSDNTDFDAANFQNQFMTYREEILKQIDSRNLNSVFNSKLTGDEFLTVDRQFIHTKLVSIDGLRDDRVSSEFYLGSNLTWDKNTYDLRTWKKSPGSILVGKYLIPKNNALLQTDITKKQ